MSPTCVRCNNLAGDMFAPNGDAVCKGCFYTQDANARESAGGDQLFFAAIAGLVLSVLVLPLAFISVRLGGILCAVLLTGGVSALRQGLAIRRRRRLG